MVDIPNLTYYRAGHTFELGGSSVAWWSVGKFLYTVTSNIPYAAACEKVETEPYARMDGKQHFVWILIAHFDRFAVRMQILPIPHHNK